MISIAPHDKNTKYVHYLTPADEKRLRRFRLPQVLTDEVFHIRRLPETVSFAMQWDPEYECHLLI